MMTGACFCKAIKYEVVAESMMQGLCYCADCQTVGGSAYWASYAISPEHFRLTSGELKKYTSRSAAGRAVERYFCGDCGTQIKVQSNDVSVASVNAMTFDDPTHFRPQYTHFAQSAPHWCDVHPKLSPFQPPGE